MSEMPLKYDFDRNELLMFVPENAHTLLDVGCGSGAFGKMLRFSRPGMELWAIEPDPSSANAAQNEFDHVITAGFPDPRIPDNRFDVVLCADVLEHMAEPGKALDASSKALAEGGIMVASIPNVRHWRAVLWPLIGHGRWTYTDRGILDRTHLRFFTKRSMHDFFTDHGWSIQSITGVNMIRRERLLSALSARLLDDFLFPQYVVVARPPKAVELVDPAGGSVEDKVVRDRFEITSACLLGEWGRVRHAFHPVT
jgi:2-polyprenyl-3-methyl-5-hydroxy-6-metoxy-1,4-benzoquinol methylase